MPVGTHPLACCLLGNIPKPLFTCFARLRICRKGDAFCKLHVRETQPFSKKMIGGGWFAQQVKVCMDSYRFCLLIGIGPVLNKSNVGLKKSFFRDILL